MASDSLPGIWFPTIRTGSGADVFVERLVAGLQARGIRAEAYWLPHRAEFAPWSCPVPSVPRWAGIAHLNPWVPLRFVPRGIPVVQTLHFCVHDPAFAAYRSARQAVYHRLLIRRREHVNLCRASAVVAVSADTAAKASLVFGRSDIRVIRNGVPTDRAFRVAPRDTPGRPFRLLYLGNWSRRKGSDLLAPIMRLLGDRFELAFTGDRQGAQSRFESPPHSVSLGRLRGEAEVALACQDADALLFPSRLEGLPLGVLEAMACGLPVIAARASSLPEVVEHGREGLLCVPDKAEDFAQAAMQLLEHPQLWQRMRAQARWRAETEFSEDRMVQRYIDLYRELARPEVLP